jgi:hypothetical protein
MVMMAQQQQQQQGDENDVEQGRDVPDARLMVTVDSVGRQFSASMPVPIHSCLNIATQGEVDESCGGRSAVSCMTRALKKHIIVAIVGLLVVVLIIVLEKLLGAELIDEKKLIQDISAQLLPQLAGTQPPTTTKTTAAAHQ